MHIALVRDAGVCLAVKSISGTRIAAQVALLELLRRFGWLTDAELARLPRPDVRDDNGNQVGEIRLRILSA
jgi:L-asparaginase II